MTGRGCRGRVFLLSPASCSGKRAQLVMRDGASFELARRLRENGGVPIGELFAFLSGLYFRGKLAYAGAFAQPPAGVEGVFVITPDDGLRPVDEPVGLPRLRRFAAGDIDAANPRYSAPLRRDAERLAAALSPDCELVLLGSVATGKYVDVLVPVLGDRLRFPSAFVGRGDMSRGGLMLRCVRDAQELEYVPVAGAIRHGERPPRLAPLA
jgi:hypothetical protein